MIDPWVQGYVQASFRGARFWMQRATIPLGRRIVPHTYPRSDALDLEDQGVVHPVLSFDGYILGKDYYAPRDKFEAALRQPGAGELVHPYYRGVLIATAGACEGVEDADAGGMIRYGLTFYIQSATAPLRVKLNTDQRLKNAKAAGNAANKKSITDVYTVEDKIFGALADAQGTIDQGLDQIKKAKQIAAIGAEFQHAIQNAQGRLIALSLNADLIADTFTDLINWGADPESYEQFGTTAADTGAMLIEQRRLFDYFRTPAADISGDLPASYASNKIRTFCAVSTVFARGGVCRAATFDTVEDVAAFKTSLFRDIDDLIRDTVTDADLIAALQDYRAAVFDFLQTKLLTLPFLVLYTPTAPQSSLTLSYMVYGDLDHEADIVSRNKLIHPGFISAGVDLWLETTHDQK